MAARRMRTVPWALLVGSIAVTACTGGGGGDGELEVSESSPSESTTLPETTLPETTLPETTAPEDRPDADLQEFCDAYDAFVEANEADLAVDEVRAVAELAPPGTEAYLELLAALWAAGAGSDPDGDLTGDMDYMELVVAMRQPGPRRAEQRLHEILEEDCGRDVGVVIG